MTGARQAQNVGWRPKGFAPQSTRYVACVDHRSYGVTGRTRRHGRDGVVGNSRPVAADARGTESRGRKGILTLRGGAA